VVSIKEDFASRKTRGNGYYVSIICPNTDMSGVVREQKLFNRVSKELLDIKIGEAIETAQLAGRPFNAVIVKCGPFDG